MRIVFPILQLDESRGVELEVIYVELFGRSDNFGLIRLWPTRLHIIAVILINRVIAFPFPLGRLNPNEVFPLQTVSSGSRQTESPPLQSAMSQAAFF